MNAVICLTTIVIKGCSVASLICDLLLAVVVLWCVSDRSREEDHKCRADESVCDSYCLQPVPPTDCYDIIIV